MGDRQLSPSHPDAKAQELSLRPQAYCPLIKGDMGEVAGILGPTEEHAATRVTYAWPSCGYSNPVTSSSPGK